MDRFTFDDLYVRRLKEHDREIGDHFVEYFSPLLLARLRRHLPAQDVEDARQDVLWRALAKLDTLRESSKLGAFVWGICSKVLLERGKVSRTEPLNEWHLQIVSDWNIEAEFLRNEAAATVRQILSRMRNRREAEILRAIYLDEKDRAEVCRQFNLSAENLRVVLHRALKDFAAALGRKKKGPAPPAEPEPEPVTETGTAPPPATATKQEQPNEEEPQPPP